MRYQKDSKLFELEKKLVNFQEDKAKGPDGILFTMTPSVTITLFFIAVTFGAGNAAQPRFSSYSGEYGVGGGTAFTHSGVHMSGTITALRIRESTSYVVGIQVRYGNVWSNYEGNQGGTLHEINLYPGEYINQVSGKQNSYIAQLIFVTNLGRMFHFGQPSGTCFNSFPIYRNTILRYISGRHNGGVITAIAFHYDMLRDSNGNCITCKEGDN
ncbi:zymogen granule membrane protein 16-like [Protopterus annectens]|uniref:zymogen granule membrane protein 16-like n=1 Tax=Protopterus annectens TaxID=7888 RepID=UPI001CFA063C|nr:zymogen granule membrane protein 16-like [Protopterus annectens]